MKKLSVVLCLVIFLFLFSSSKTLALDAPNLTSPLLGSTTDDTSPTLSWNWGGTCVSPPANCYRVQVDDQADFSSSDKKDHYTSTTSYSPQLTDGTWYWRVEAKDSTSTWSPWTQVWNFTIDQSNPPPPPPPTPNPPPPSSAINVSLSEFMPNPSEGQEWVEIYNRGATAANLAGWKIDDALGGSSPSSLGESFLIEPAGFALFYFGSKLNNDGDTLRILKADNTEVEVVNFGTTTKGVSFAKDEKGAWQQTITPTPGRANKISKSSVLSATNNETDSQLSKNTQDLGQAVLKNLAATISSHSQKPVNTNQLPVPKSPSNIFLPVIFVGSGLILILASILVYAIKTGIIKKPLFRKGKAPEENSSSASEGFSSD